MQINEAMFVGSRGWVLKPEKMRGFGDETVGKVRFVGEIAGVSSCAFCFLSLSPMWRSHADILGGCLEVPQSDYKQSFSAYVRAELFHSGGKQEWKSPVVEVTNVPETGVDISWNKKEIEVQQFEWEYESEDLAFIRYVRSRLAYMEHAYITDQSRLYSLMVIRHHELMEHEDLAVFCAKINHLESGWRLVRLLDMKGKNTGATLLVRFRRE
jgi:phosphatidylinositol phospholipase C delta